MNPLLWQYWTVSILLAMKPNTPPQILICDWARHVEKRENITSSHILWGFYFELSPCSCVWTKVWYRKQVNRCYAWLMEFQVHKEKKWRHQFYGNRSKWLSEINELKFMETDIWEERRLLCEESLFLHDIHFSLQRELFTSPLYNNGACPEGKLLLVNKGRICNMAKSSLEL